MFIEINFRKDISTMKENSWLSVSIFYFILHFFYTVLHNLVFFLFLLTSSLLNFILSHLPSSPLLYVKVDDDLKVTRSRKDCPHESCGAGVRMAVHKDRLSCGKCSLTFLLDGENAHQHRMTRVGNPFLIELLSNRRQPLHEEEGNKEDERE